MDPNQENARRGSVTMYRVKREGAFQSNESLKRNQSHFEILGIERIVDPLPIESKLSVQPALHTGERS